MGTNNKYKDAIECVYLVVKNGLEQDIPQIDDAETKSKIEFILSRIRNVEKYCDNIYAYFFKEQKSVYVGRTININLRNDQHKTDKSSSVLQFAKAHKYYTSNAFKIFEKYFLNKKVGASEQRHPHLPKR